MFVLCSIGTDYVLECEKCEALRGSRVKPSLVVEIPIKLSKIRDVTFFMNIHFMPSSN